MPSFEWGALRVRQPNLDPETVIVAADARDPSAIPPPLQDASEAPRGQVFPSLFASLVVAADHGWARHAFLLRTPGSLFAFVDATRCLMPLSGRWRWPCLVNVRMTR